MPTIFDLVTSPEITAYWETMIKDRPPLLGEELFPADKKLGLELKWLKGSNGLPIVLKPSAPDVAAVPRPRMSFDRLSAEMPNFKESKYVDESMRQQLNMVMESGNQAYIDSILNNIFNDQMQLLEGAAVRREMMRMSALTTGGIAISANGQAMTYDYGMPDNHKATVTKSWSDPTANLLDDIRRGIETIEDDTGIRPTRAIVNAKTWQYFVNNEIIRKSIYVLSQGQSTVADAVLRAYIREQLELEIAVYSKKYINDRGIATKYVPDDSFTLFPTGALGTTWFGTTAEESDLMAKQSTNVSITDVGVAVTAMTKDDPVTVETKVTMLSLPSFETADQVYQLDVSA